MFKHLLIHLSIIGICLTGPVFGEEQKVILQTVPGNPTTPACASLIVTGPRGSMAFIDVNSFDGGWQAEIARPDTLFALTVNEFEHSFQPPVYKTPGAKLILKPGTIANNDIRITGISASRFDDTIDGSNYILLIEVGGFRVAHFGDCGQSILTKEQLDQLGRVDIAIYPVEWMDSNVTLGNKKSFKILGQVNPTMVIPSHIGSATALRLLNQSWPCRQIPGGKITLTSSMLSRGKQGILWGANLGFAQKHGLPVDETD